MAKEKLNTYWGEVSTLHLPKIATIERNFISISFYSIIANRVVTKNRYRSLISSSLHLCIANRLALATSFLLLFITSFLVPSFLVPSSLHSQIPSYVPTNGLVGYWPFNGNANDESGNGNHGTVNGATLTSDRVGNSNAAFLFSGLNCCGTPDAESEITISSPFISLNANFTISCWMRSSDVTKYQQCLFNSINHTGFGVELNNEHVPGRLTSGIGPADAFWDLLYSQGSYTNYQSNTWYFVTFVKSGTSYTTYLNGNIDCTVSVPNAVNYNQIVGIRFGSIGGGHENFKGTIDDISIHNRALSLVEIIALYNGVPSQVIAGCTNTTACNYNAAATQEDGSCTYPAQTYLNCGGTCINDADNDGTCDELETPALPSYLPSNGLVGYWPFNGNANDESGNGNNGTVNGATLTTDRNGNANSAFGFDGQDDFIEIPYDNSFNTIENITISTWININDWCTPNVNGVKFFPILVQYNNGNANPTAYGNFGIQLTEVGLNYFYLNSNNFDFQNSSPNYWMISQWVNIVVTVEGGVGNWYINGMHMQTIYGQYFGGSMSGLPILIGKQSPVPGFGSGSIYANGLLDDIAIYNRALTQEEIIALYNGTTNSPITGCTNTTACNYNASATQDDGSCTFPAQTYLNCAGSCINDADNDGICDELETPALPSYLPSNGLVGYWPFNGNANDESGNGNHGTVLGNINYRANDQGRSNCIELIGDKNTFPTNAFGEPLYVNGGHIKFPNLSSEISNSISINLWIRSLDSSPVEYAFFSGMDDSGQNRLVFDYYNGFFLGDNNPLASVLSPFNVNISQWKMLTLTYSLGVLKAYINNEIVGNDIVTISSIPIANAALNWHQWANGNVARGWSVYDDVAIYNRALTQEEITALYNGTSNTSIAGCTDPTAFNYNANANQDDGSCIPMLTCNITASATTICEGESVTLSMNTTGVGTGLNALPANLQQGLVAYYPFNGNANDESGNGNNGTVNGATLTADRFGNANGAYSFDGVDDWISVIGLMPENNSNRTISTWINLENYITDAGIVGWGNFSMYNYSAIGVSPTTGKLFFWTYGNDVTTVSMNNLNSWINVAISYDNSENRVKLYLNGVLDTDNIISSLFTSNSNLHIGKSLQNSSTYFSGKIDDITIHNRALSPSEIQQLHTAQSYNWSNGGTSTTTTVSPTTTTTYSCTVTQGAQTCTASVDVTVNPLLTFYADADGDGFGNVNAPQFACVQPAGTVTNNTDCNDNDAALNTISDETCNSFDDDCDGSVDEGVLNTYYLDMDGDGFGVISLPILACSVPLGYSDNIDDCNDYDPLINANGIEICNGADDDCDAQIDEELPVFTWFIDNDGDGIGTGISTESCAFLPGYATIGGDCNDNDATISPVANEICNNVDENCDGVLNDGIWIAAYIDADGDGYGANNISIDGLCELTAGFVGNNQDCDDNEPLAYTGAIDVCDNGIDEDCSGSDNTCIVMGCTDLTACNYNELANTEDFSCTYPQMDYLNCQGACNHDTDGDGVCDEIELLGCTVITASNFNPEATEDDGSCIFNIEGCTDIQACNFDPAANFDNGSCILPQPETCNGVDDDCDDLIDEGLTPIGLNVIPIVTSIYPVCSGNSLKSANLNNGINSEVIDGNGNDLWFSLNAQYNTLRAGLSAATGDNDIRLYQLTTNGCLQHIETEHEVTAGNQTLISDQLTSGNTYYIAIHHLSGNMNPSAKICFNHLTGSVCDHYYSNNTGVYTSVCNSFKAQFRSNATAYMFEVLSASQNGSNTNITPWSYTTPTANSVVSRLGAILPANQTGSPIQYVLRVPVIYSMFDAAGNMESILANATGTCNLTLNNENTIALRLSDRCPATKSLSGSIAPDRTVCGAVRYDWEFTQTLPVESTPQIINGGNYTPIFFLSNVPGIATGKTYSVRVRPVHGSGSVGNWGVSHCLRVGNSGMIMQETIEQSQDVISLFTIYPNPTTSGSFEIQTNWTDEKEENVQVSIQDITGKIVFNQYVVLNNNTSVIEFGNLADGIYMVTIGEERKRLQILKK